MLWKSGIFLLHRNIDRVATRYQQNQYNWENERNWEKRMEAKQGKTGR